MTDRNDAYAAALLEIAKAEGNLDTVEDELFRVARTIESNEALRSTLTDQAIPVDRRQKIVEALLDGKASPVTTALVSFVVGGVRLTAPVPVMPMTSEFCWGAFTIMTPFAVSDPCPLKEKPPPSM